MFYCCESSHSGLALLDCSSFLLLRERIIYCDPSSTVQDWIWVLPQSEGLMILTYTLNWCISTVLMWQAHTKCHREVWLSFLINTFGSDTFLKNKQKNYRLLNLGACVRHLLASIFTFSPCSHTKSLCRSVGVSQFWAGTGTFFMWKKNQPKCWMQKLCVTFSSGPFYCSAYLLLHVMLQVSHSL